MRSITSRGGYVAGVRRWGAALVVGSFVIGGAACTVIDGVGVDPSEEPDAAPTSTATTPVPTGTATGTGTPDAGPAPTDAAADATLADAEADATSDAEVDGGAVDGATDGGATPVMPGADGVLRGTVSGPRTHEWVGKIRLPNATCPAGATTITSGAISCCAFAGSFGSLGGAVPVVFDPVTRSGTLAGAPIGPLAAPITEADGTLRFQAAAFLEAPKAWAAGIEMARAAGAPAGEIAEATRMYENPALMRAVSDSLKYMVVTWNPTTKVFRIRFELTNFQATAAGTCGIVGGQETSARLLFDLR
jgi:hypothetical protein